MSLTLEAKAVEAKAAEARMTEQRAAGAPSPAAGDLAPGISIDPVPGTRSGE